ncbi:hypothetical protein ACOME3_009824 [Neoechinorhynchus agilis]
MRQFTTLISAAVHHHHHHLMRNISVQTTVLQTASTVNPALTIIVNETPLFALRIFTWLMIIIINICLILSCVEMRVHLMYIYLYLQHRKRYKRYMNLDQESTHGSTTSTDDDDGVGGLVIRDDNT